ncbi:hypothetical protein D1007_16344 [Hordeum vulgare]|nr:hypothetical protein D1007_16344 [Hordeum vulgare]
MFTAAQWRARERRRDGARGRDDDDGTASTASGGRDNHRGKSYKCDVRGHFKRECPLLRKELAAGHALMMDADVEDAGLL